MTNPEQRWRPIALMPAFKYAVSSAAETAHAQAENMRRALGQQDVINRIELARMRVVYEDTALYVRMCQEQLQRWREESSSADQKAMLDRLDVIVDKWAHDIKAILDAVNVLLHRV
jgi:hypothetical protein